MEKLICFIIAVLILLLPIMIIYIIQAFIKKEKKRKLVILSLIFVGILLPVIIFYLPFQVSLQGYKQVEIDIHMYGNDFVISNPEKIKEFSRLIEKQRFIRSIDKTLFGTPLVSSDQVTGMFIIGNEGIHPTINIYIRCRSDFAKYSYIEKDFYRCSIQNSEDFVRNIKELVAQTPLQSK